LIPDQGPSDDTQTGTWTLPFANNFLSNQGKYSDKDIFKNLIIQLEKI